MTFKPFGGDTEPCRACGGQVSTDAIFCPHCNEPLAGFKFLGGDTIPCRACGEPVSTDADVCPHCHEPLAPFKLFGQTCACHACGEQVSTDAVTCPHCYEPLVDFKLFGETVACRACGGQVSSDAKVCPHCHEPLIGFKLLGGDTEPCRACGYQVSINAVRCPNCGEPFGDDPAPVYGMHTVSASQRSISSSKDSNSSNDWFIKLLFYGAMIIGALCLAFAVVLPLVFINWALLALGAAWVWKKYRYVYLGISVAGLVYILLDHRNGWYTRKLGETLSFFNGTMSWFLYLNIAAGLFSAFLLSCFLLDHWWPITRGTGSFPKRNLIVLAAIVAAGVLIIWLSKPGLRVGETNVNTVTYTTAQTTTPVVMATPGADGIGAPANTGQSTTQTTATSGLTGVQLMDSIVTAFLADSASVKTAISGTAIPGNSLQASEDIKSYSIRNKIITADSLILTIDLELAENSEAELEIHYERADNSLINNHQREIYITKDIAVPANDWVQFCPVPHTNWITKDDSKMTWRTADGQEINTGADMGPVTLPPSACYWLKSREEGSLVMKFTFRPKN